MPNCSPHPSEHVFKHLFEENNMKSDSEASKTVQVPSEKHVIWMLYNNTRSSFCRQSKQNEICYCVKMEYARST